MSTNYYIKGYTDPDVDKDSPEWHVGKRTGAGKGKTNFTWAMSPINLLLRLRFLGLNGNTEKCIISRNGEYTYWEFREHIVEEAEEVFEHSIGKKFS